MVKIVLVRLLKNICRHKIINNNIHKDARNQFCAIIKNKHIVEYRNKYLEKHG